MSNINLNEVMPFILFWIPWILAVRELRNHFRHGYMTEYLRRSSEDFRDNATRTTTAAQHPISYRLLFVFYSAIVIAVPILTVYVLYSRANG